MDVADTQSRAPRFVPYLAPKELTEQEKLVAPSNMGDPHGSKHPVFEGPSAAGVPPDSGYTFSFLKGTCETESL